MSCLHIIRWWSTFSLYFRATVFFRAATGVAAAPPLDLWSLLRANGESGEKGANPHLRRRAGQGVDSKNSSYNPFDCSCCHSYRFRYYLILLLLHLSLQGEGEECSLVFPDVETAVAFGTGIITIATFHRLRI